MIIFNLNEKQTALGKTADLLKKYSKISHKTDKGKLKVFKIIKHIV